MAFARRCSPTINHYGNCEVQLWDLASFNRFWKREKSNLFHSDYQGISKHILQICEPCHGSHHSQSLLMFCKVQFNRPIICLYKNEYTTFRQYKSRYINKKERAKSRRDRWEKLPTSINDLNEFRNTDMKNFWISRKKKTTKQFRNVQG